MNLPGKSGTDNSVRQGYTVYMNNENQNLIDKIQDFLLKLDRESLIFLKDQASVLLYNKEIREKNSLLQEQQNSEGKKPIKEFEEQTETAPIVYFEQLKNGKFFNLYIQDAQLFMDKQEIRAILKIAKATESPEAGSIRLFNWFKKERKDVLVDGHISNSGHPALLLIYKELLETFSID